MPLDSVAGLRSFPETQKQVTDVNAGMRTAPLVDRKKFNADLENIVINALTGASIARNEFIASNPSGMGAADQKLWGKRPSASDYSYGERVALYLGMAIHIARK